MRKLKVDFCYGIGVQMSPSDIVLKINPNIAGYNNLVRRADKQDGITFSLGKNPSINSQVLQQIPVEKGVYVSPEPTVPTPVKPIPPATRVTSAATAPVIEHEENKATLILLLALFGGAALMLSL